MRIYSTIGVVSVVSNFVLIYVLIFYSVGQIDEALAPKPIHSLSRHDPYDSQDTERDPEINDANEATPNIIDELLSAVPGEVLL